TGAEAPSGLEIAGAGLLVVTLAALAGLVTEGRAIVRGGGWLGGFVATALRELVGGPGACLALTGLLVVALVLATGVSAIAVASRPTRTRCSRTRASSRPSSRTSALSARWSRSVPGR